MDVEQMCKRFNEEASGSPYITKEYLEQFCNEYRDYYSLIPPFVWVKLYKWEVLLECEGWQIQRLKKDNYICILDSEHKCRVEGKCEQILAPILCDIHARKKIEELKTQGKLDYGIVFCGGGAKGAFQLGVWKKLKEYDIAECFTGISGASVGALNALLFAQGNYEKAMTAWMEMKNGDLMRPNINLIQIVFNNIFSSLPVALLSYIFSNWSKIAGLFSREKLENIVRKNIKLESLQDKLVYISLSVFATLKPKKFGEPELFLQSEYTYLDTKSENSEEININKVLASAALPGAYTPLEVYGKNCIDGGVLDNEPVYPLIKAGYRNILVVHLKMKEEDGENRLEAFNESLRKKFSEEELKGVTIHHIWPQQSLKGLLEINPELTQMRIDEGWKAADGQLEYSFLSNCKEWTRKKKAMKVKL